MSARGRIASVVALGALLTLGAGWKAQASTSREVGGVRFADTREAGGESVLLLNAALYRYLVFDVYAAALYLAPGAGPHAALSEHVARRLEVVYLRDISATDLARAARAVLERNLGAVALAALAPRIERLHGLYPDVAEGDRIALEWLPGRGTTLEINGRRLGTIEGADFAHAYFAIWLGAEPIDDDLRAALLAPADDDRATTR